MAVKLSIIFALALTLLPFATSFTNPVYIISNAETPSLDLPGLTPIGKKRSEKCLPPVRFLRNVAEVPLTIVLRFLPLWTLG